MMTGDKVGAEEAAQMGMIHQYFSADDFVEESMKLATKLAQMPTYGLGMTKRLLNQSMNNNLSEQLAAEGEIQTQCADSYDYNEGVNAFLEKESPFLKESKMKVGVLGCGAMGSGIAQIAATNGHAVVLVDNNEEALVKSAIKLKKILTRLVEKEKIDQATADTIIGRIEFTSDNQQFAECGILIEAIVERLDVKQAVFANLENIVSDDCILATNTSSLSVASIAASCEKAERVIGIHFFNPAPLMPLVEIIPRCKPVRKRKI